MGIHTKMILSPSLRLGAGDINVAHNTRKKRSVFIHQKAEIECVCIAISEQVSMTLKDKTQIEVGSRVTRALTELYKHINEDTQKCHNHEAQPSRDTKRRGYEKQIGKKQQQTNKKQTNKKKKKKKKKKSKNKRQL